MKLSHLNLTPLLAAVALALMTPVALRAQSQQTNQATSPSPASSQCGGSKGHCGNRQGHHPWCHNGHNGWVNLTASEQQQLKADMAKIHNDPQLVAAEKTLCSDRQAMRQIKRELLLQADPSIKPLLNKIEHEERWAHIGHWFSRVIHFGKCTQQEGHERHGMWANLSDNERQQLKTAMEKIHSDPKLIAAHKTLWNDMKALHQVKDNLLLKVDPSIKPVLDKMGFCKPRHCYRHSCKGKLQK